MALTYDLTLLPPAQMAIDLVGTSIESDKSLSGITSAIDFAGGGSWSVKYRKVQLKDNPAQHRYWSLLRNTLNGGVRTIIVPMLTDWIVPLAVPKSPVFVPVAGPGGTITQQSAVAAQLAADAALNAGAVQVKITMGGALVGGEIFAIQHATKNWRCYGVTDIDDVTDPGDSSGLVYTVGIRPTMREAAASGTSVEFARPRCLMRLMQGTSLSWDVQGYWQSTPDIEFMEAFP